MNKFLTKHEYKILFIVTALFFLSMFFMLFSSKVFASSPDGILPYNIPDYKSYNNIMLNDTFINTCISAYCDEFNLPLDTPLLIYTDYGFDGTYFHYVVASSPTCQNGIGEAYNYISNSITFTSSNYCRAYHIHKDTGRIDGVSWLGYNFQLFGAFNEIDTSIGSYVPNYPFFYNGEDIYSLGIDSSNKVFIITNNVPYDPGIPGQGHATPPINNTGHYIPGVNPQKPNITPFNPTSPNYPNVDNSNTDTLLESLISIVVYGFSFNGDRLKDSINYVTGTQSDLTDYIVDTINRAQNNIIGAIQDFADDFYNNMVSLFEPITQQLAYITQEVDADLITQGIENTSLHNDYSSIVGVKDTFVSVFTDTQEPETFVIPVHLEEISILNTPIQYIDLSIINPVKGILRTFAWVFTTFALVVTVLDSIPGYVNGGADE